VRSSFIDPAASGHVLGVVVQESVREREHLQHALIGDSVIDRSDAERLGDETGLRAALRASPSYRKEVISE
jgi:hypothetical protein